MHRITRSSFVLAVAFLMASCGGEESPDAASPLLRGAAGDVPCEEKRWSPDADGDGFGSVWDPAVTSCERPETYVDNARDCDDRDPQTSPSMPERCDGQDNDCDGQVDEDDACPACEEFVCLPPDSYVSVKAYYWRDQLVFGVGSGCCDKYDPVFTASCRYLCSPSGGYDGNGDGRCPEFFDEAIKLSCD